MRASHVTVFAAALVLASAGCGGQTSGGAPRAIPTFSKDIAPILLTHCTACHRPGQSAPFSLEHYADVRPRAEAIADAVAARRMPPWLPEIGRPAFEGERRLPDEALAAIRAWVAHGAPEGDITDLPAAPQHSDWQLGQPDLVATTPQPYVLENRGHDVYRNLVYRLPLTSTRFVRALEFSPGNAPVHHAVIRIDRLHTSRASDGADGQPGFEGMAAHEVQDPDGHFLGWAPGRGPITAPADLPWVLHQGSDLVVELHLMPGSQRTVPVQPTIGLFFTDTPPNKTPVMIVMGSKAIDIPPGAREHAIEDRYQLPVDAELRSVYPHAHYLGRTMEVQALLPDGTARQLLNIRRWSFNWQQDYRLQTPLSLPKGTTIAMRFTYDNSDSNRANPHRPPRRVTWGPQSHDEMGNLGVQLVTRTPDDAARLTASFAQHAIRIDLLGAETLVKANPENAAHHALLGTSYVRSGRFSEAIPPLQRALTIDPTSASNENYLAGALLALGRGSDALEHFRRASALSPGDPHLHFNFGKVLSSAGRNREAIDEFTRALAIDPGFADAHQHLGVVYFSSGRLPLALTHLRRATELAPGLASAHADYGGALAQAGRRDEALQHLQRALQLDPTDATARENLARLQALRRQ